MLTTELEADTADLHIEIEVDAEARTLTVRDNGIGMSREEVVSLIGTIAKSGTAELLRKLKDSKEKESAELIGQFGVGFYSTFMVADRVTLLTRRAGEDTGTRWESAGEGTYTIDTVDDAPQGTAVTVHLRPKDEEALNQYLEENWKPLEAAIEKKDFAAFETAFHAAIDMANAYHELKDKPYIRWKLPDHPPPDMDLTPRGKK